eukprot:CAMPEP_0182435772 /NCGR_PEP_ID=MMETSP1167-20130531/77550_1 /TAXON_ID=2988 /ORGANISM="Mallomonas Sp, Strain CCMP3275" /LENGTH=350 /DNA_ID=CAMNT_0024627179 /DNA_START=188 /DNA_END=1240 /DNA_ORIENTATION=+
MAGFVRKAHTALDEIGRGDGKFKRVDSGHREIISVDHPIYKPESGRYHLYVSYACPWAHRCLIGRKMKGLEEVIGLSVVHPTWQLTDPDVDEHAGWVFRSPNDSPVIPRTGYGAISCEDCISDDINQCQTVRQLYEKSNDTHKKYSVPVLWDKQTSSIVNNESSEILRMFNSAFNTLVGKSETPTPDLYPENDKALLKAIDEVNEWVYPGINNGVYKCGFAKSQEAYKEAVSELTIALDRVESILAVQRYICGTMMTEADIRLYVTLVRFDEVYVVYFKTNKKCIREYPNIQNYLRELWQLPAFKETTHMNHIKNHYFTSHPVLNAYSVVPVGPDTLTDLALPHNRDRQY